MKKSTATVPPLSRAEQLVAWYAKTAYCVQPRPTAVDAAAQQPAKKAG